MASDKLIEIWKRQAEQGNPQAQAKLKNIGKPKRKQPTGPSVRVPPPKVFDRKFSLRISSKMWADIENECEDFPKLNPAKFIRSAIELKLNKWKIQNN